MNLSLAYTNTNHINMRELSETNHHLINNGPSPTSSPADSSPIHGHHNTVPTSSVSNHNGNVLSVPNNGLNSTAYYHNDSHNFGQSFTHNSQYQEVQMSSLSNRTSNTSIHHHSSISSEPVNNGNTHHNDSVVDTKVEISQEELQNFINNLDILPLRQSEKRDLKNCIHPTTFFKLISEYKYDLNNVEEIKYLVQLRKYLYNNISSVVDIPFHIFIKLWPLMDNILKSCHGSKHLKSSKTNMNNGLLYTQPFVCRCTTRNSTVRKHSNENGELQLDIDESDETKRGSVYNFQPNQTSSETVSFAKIEASKFSNDVESQPIPKKRRFTKITIFTKPCHYKVNLAIDFTNQIVVYKPSNDCTSHLHSVDYVDSMKKSSFINNLIQEEAMRGYSAEELKKILDYYDTIFPSELNLSLVGVPHIRNKMIKVVSTSTGSDYLKFPRPSILNSLQPKHSSAPNIHQTYVPIPAQNYNPYYIPPSESSRGLASDHQQVQDLQQQQQQQQQQHQQQQQQQQQISQSHVGSQHLPPLKTASQQFTQPNQLSIQTASYQTQPQQYGGHSPIFEKLSLQNPKSCNFPDHTLGFENIQFTH